MVCSTYEQLRKEFYESRKRTRSIFGRETDEYDVTSLFDEEFNF